MDHDLGVHTYRDDTVSSAWTRGRAKVMRVTIFRVLSAFVLRTDVIASCTDTTFSVTLKKDKKKLSFYLHFGQKSFLKANKRDKLEIRASHCSLFD